MESASIAASRANAARPFAPLHRWDRNFFLTLICMVWLGILVGFGWDVFDHLNRHAASWPPIVHLHAMANLSWLVLLTTQAFLIRLHRPDLHKRLGLYGLGLAVVMVPLAAGAAWTMDIRYLGTKDEDPAFLAIQLVDLVVFTSLVASAFLLRRNSSAHKRLMLLSTLQISDAGFARWLGFLFPNLFGLRFWLDYVAFYLPVDLLVLAIGMYDLITRKRLHPAWLMGAAFLFAVELFGLWLYVTPAWKPIALQLLGH